MGKKKKRRTSGSSETGRNEVYDTVTPNDNSTNSSVYTEKKQKRKGERRFGEALLRQSVEDGWEGHEKAKLALLLASTLELNDEKLLSLIAKAEVLDPLMVAGMQDLGFEFENSSSIIEILFEQSSSRQRFLKTYSNALDNSIVSVRDLSMIMKLSSISELNNFAREEIVQLLRISCSHSETLKCCGQLLHAFCMNMLQGQAEFYITEVLKFDFVLDLFGLLEDLLDELGDLRSVVEKPIKEILKVNRIGEIVDSDADDDGNLRDFIVGDDASDPDGSDNSSCIGGANRKSIDAILDDDSELCTSDSQSISSPDRSNVGVRGSSTSKKRSRILHDSSASEDDSSSEDSCRDFEQFNATNNNKRFLSSDSDEE